MNQNLAILARAAGMARGLPATRSGSGIALPPDFDEKALVDCAIQHKVARGALEGLRLLGFSLSPGSVAALREHSRSSALRAALAFREAGILCAEFARRGIASMVIKGPAAAMQFYGDFKAREFYDLDIVVNAADAASVAPIMAQAGYAPMESAIPETTGPKSGFPERIVQRGHHIGFSSRAKPFRVEIHDRKGWEAEPFGHENLDEVLARSVRIEGMTDGVAVSFQAPSMADHAALLIAHGAQHAWCLLHWLLDAAKIFSSGEPGFQEALASTLTRNRLTRQAKVAGLLVSRFYPIDFADPIKRLFSEETARLDRAVLYALSRLERGGRDLARIRSQIFMPLFFLAPQAAGARLKLKLILAPFRIPPGDMAALPLPGQLWFLHILARPFFVLSRRAKRTLERIK